MLLFWKNSANVREICGKLKSSLARRKRSNFFRLDLSLRDTECNGHPDVLNINEHQRTESLVGVFVLKLGAWKKPRLVLKTSGQKRTSVV